MRDNAGSEDSDTFCESTLGEMLHASTTLPSLVTRRAVVSQHLSESNRLTYSRAVLLLLKWTEASKVMDKFKELQVEPKTFMLEVESQQVVSSEALCASFLIPDQTHG